MNHKSIYHNKCSDESSGIKDIKPFMNEKRQDLQSRGWMGGSFLSMNLFFN